LLHGNFLGQYGQHFIYFITLQVLGDVIWAQPAFPLNDIMFLFTLGVCNLSLYKHWAITVQLLCSLRRASSGNAWITKIYNIFLLILAVLSMGFRPVL
jgi:hypothetical protein